MSRLDIQHIRNTDVRILTYGSHPAIIQSVLDFDFLQKKEKPSIVGIIANGRRFERYFFGNKEVMIPVYTDFGSVPSPENITYLLNLSSARRVLIAGIESLDALPNLIGGVIFAEDVPEKHALELYNYSILKDKYFIGPASVGIVVPGAMKLGAIGGTQKDQIITSRILQKGSVAVLSASGGMVNEIINIVTSTNHALSFSLSFGGDRFPILTPRETFLAAEADPQTKTIVYYGELGGEDEYEIATLLREGAITKEVICYIGGVISDLFETPPQFGHAKAMAGNNSESASEKRKILLEAGAKVGGSFAEFVELIKNITPDVMQDESDFSTIVHSMDERKKSLITTSISKDEKGDVKILGEDLLSFSQNNSFSKIVASLFLGKKIQSHELEEFVDFVLRISVDHGPYVSGAVNTIVTARAGRDLVSALAAGLLTIGPRFGGALNQSAANWLNGVQKGVSAYDFVEDFASRKEYIQGIGHRKYRVDFPDPRVAALKEFAGRLDSKRFLGFALEVEKVTVGKKGNLILNVDGAIAAIMLDILSEKEGCSDEELQHLVDQEFFNAVFVLSRSVGFIAHYLDQKRLDEGLFRLEEEHVGEATTE